MMPQDYLGGPVEVLFEEKVKGRWKGRTPTNKLVFTESDENLRGQVRKVLVTWAGPWSMQGRLPGEVLLPQPLLSIESGV